MHPLLHKLLKKREIRDVKDLSKEEKSDFSRWEKTLSEQEVTVDNIAGFCANQIGLIESRWKQPKDDDKLRSLVSQHVVYSAMLGITTKPKSERASLVKFLESLL